MNLQVSEQPQFAGAQAVSRKKTSDPLSERVRQSLDEYFDHLNGTEPNDLYQLVMAQTERPLFERVMQHTGGNQTRAAAVLGISRATLRKKLALYNID
jgi:Fis family transcriptional regulator, factor for inversion stimulation protein